MTKELVTLQRNVLEQSVGLGATNPFKNLTGSFDRLSGAFGGMAVNLATQRAAEQGRAEAIEFEGQPRKVAPGLTAATRAYNDAYNRTTVDLLGMRGSSLIQQNLENELSSPGFGSDSFKKFKSTTEGTIQGILKGTPEHLKADVSLQLLNSAERAGNVLSGKIAEYDRKVLNDDFNTLRSGYTDLMRESIYAGDSENEEYFRGKILETIANQKRLVGMSDADELKLQKKLKSSIITDKYVSDYYKAVAENKEATFLGKLSVKPKDLSIDEWDSAVASVLSAKKSHDRLVSGVEAINLSELDEKINSGEVSSLDELEKYRDTVSEVNYQKAESKLRNKLATETEKQLGVSQFNMLNSANPAAASLMDDKIKSAAYQDALDAELQRKKERTGDENAYLTMSDKAKAAFGYKVPIPDLNKEMSSNILYAPLDRAEDVLNAYKILSGNIGTTDSGSKALDLSGPEERIAFNALFTRESGSVSSAEALLRARDFENKSNSTAIQGRLDEWDRIYYGGNKAYKRLNREFINAFGSDSSTSPDAYKVYTKLFRGNAAYMPIEAAKALTERQMDAVYGYDKYSSNKNELVAYPPEKGFPDYQYENFYKNQFDLAAYQVAENWEKAEALIPEIPNLSKKILSIQEEINKLDTSTDEGKSRKAELNNIKEQTEIDFNAATVAAGKVGKVRWPRQYTNIKNLKIKEDVFINKRIINAPITLELWNDNDKTWEVRQVFQKSDITSTSRANQKYTTNLVYKNDLGMDANFIDPFNQTQRAEFAAKTLVDFAPDYVGKKEHEEMFKTATNMAKKLKEPGYQGIPAPLSGLADEQQILLEEKKKKEQNGKSKR